MKKLTKAMLAFLPAMMCCVALQANADQVKTPDNSFRSVYYEVPSGYTQIGTTNIYAAYAWGDNYSPSDYTFDL